MVRNLLILFFMGLLFSACTAINKPQELRGITREEITLAQVVKTPGGYRGKAVLWGGRIIRAINKKEGTLIEILQLPLDSSDRPKDVDTSGGRFLVMYPGYLDVAIYRSGREITVVGKIQGIKAMPLGEIEYRYPFIKAEKIHLWEAKPQKMYLEYPPYPYWYGPPCYLGYPYLWY